MCKGSEKWFILGGAALVGGVILVLGALRRRRLDPLAEAGRLISRCNEKISEIEESVAGLHSVIESVCVEFYTLLP